MDGLASALIAKKKFLNAKICSVQYGEDILHELIKDKSKDILENETEYRLIIVDFSFDDTDMEVAKDMFKEFIWIDHHKSAMEKMPELWNNKNVKGIRSLEKSACELCWDYFFPDKDVPYGIELIGDRDTWKFKHGDDTRYFCEYLRQYDIEDDGDINTLILIIFDTIDGIEFCIDKGTYCYNYMMAEVKRLYKKGKIEEKECFIGYTYCNPTEPYDYEKYKTFICHSNSFISELGSYALKQGDCEIAEIRQRIWNKDKQKWITVVSLRSKKDGVDVSKIAIAHGGGGHYCASGYVE